MYDLNELLKTAVAADASDIHLKADHLPFFRTHGTLGEAPGLPVVSLKDMEHMVSDLLPRHLIKEFEESHEADLAYYDPDIGRFRVNIFLAQGAPCVTMRHVKTKVPSLSELGLPPILEDLASTPRGIILLAGTTGSGKSTTLAAMISRMNQTMRRRIITVEDPVEYTFNDDQCVISQREIGLDTLSFSAALKRVLRQDPDTLLIGEMRDQNSIQTALLSAETGHLVLSTIHAGSASLAIPRMLDVFPAEEHAQLRMSLAGNLEAIICQRLIPATHGGVAPAVEILIKTPTVRKLLEKNQLDMLGAAIETGKDDGMQSFNQAIYKLIRSGTITEEEGMRFASNPEALRMNLKGIFLDEDRRILST